MSKILITRGYKALERADFYVRERRPDANDFGCLAKFASSLDYDLAHVAHGLFTIECDYRQKEVDLDGTITFLVDHLEVWNQVEIREILSDILGLALHVRSKIKFLSTPKYVEKTSPEFIKSDVNSICLFSGGIDSLSGILNTTAYLGPTIGIFVSHAKLKNTVNSLTTNYLSKAGIKIQTVILPRSHRGLQQLRGLLYLSFAAIAARMYQTDKIVVSESGPIMYQPELTALDEVTVTTHPFLIRMLKRLFKEIYGFDLSFYEPFENLTKAEVIACCPDKSAIQKTHSCIVTSYADASYSHCGKCYGCLVRRISCIVAGVQDSNYGRDVFMKGLGESIVGGWQGKSITDSTMQDLRALLLFASYNCDMLFNSLI